MQPAERHELMLATLRRALATMLLIHAGGLEVAGTGYIVDLSSDIRRLREALEALDVDSGSLH